MFWGGPQRPATAQPELHVPVHASSGWADCACALAILPCSPCRGVSPSSCAGAVPPFRPSQLLSSRAALGTVSSCRPSPLRARGFATAVAGCCGPVAAAGRRRYWRPSWAAAVRCLRGRRRGLGMIRRWLSCWPPNAPGAGNCLSCSALALSSRPGQLHPLAVWWRRASAICAGTVSTFPVPFHFPPASAGLVRAPR